MDRKEGLHRGLFTLVQRIRQGNVAEDGMLEDVERHEDDAWEDEDDWDDDEDD